MRKPKILEGRLSARDKAIRNADQARDRKEPKEAAKLYQNVIERWGPDFGILVQLGNAHKDSNAFDEAEESYKAALEIMPHDADCHLQYGHLSKLAGNLPRALEFYRQAHRLDPGLSAAIEEIDTLEAELASPLSGAAMDRDLPEDVDRTAAPQSALGRPAKRVSHWDLDAPSLIVCERVFTTFNWRRN